MHYRNFLRLNQMVSEITIGTWGLDAYQWGGYDEKEIYKTFFAARELGINCIDTAASYGDGYAEQLIGRIIRDLQWDDVFIATKIQPLITLMTPIHADQAFPGQHIIDSTEQSLRNLNVDHIPLQQLHVWDPSWLGQGDWLNALMFLKQQGKIGGIGISLFDHAPDTALEIVNTGIIDSVQLIYNIFDQSPAMQLFDLCLKTGVSVIVRSPLYEGILSGKYSKGHRFPENDWRHSFFAGGHLDECIDRIEKIYAEQPGINANNIGEYALRFALSHPAVTTVAVGMRSVNHVIKNCKASSDELLAPNEVETMKRYDWMST